MKTIKSITVKNKTIEMKNYNGIYFLIVNDRPIVNSMEFNYISSLFDQWVDEL